MPCTHLYYAFDYIVPFSKPDFTLDLDHIARIQREDPFCAPIINNPNNSAKLIFNYQNISAHNKTLF